MIKIRPVKKEDLETLAQIYAKVYEVFNVGEHWTEETALTLMEYWFQAQPDLAFCTELDGKIVGGFFTGVKPWWDGNHLLDGELFVHPDFQKRKIGAQLFKRGFEEAIKKYDAKTLTGITFAGSYQLEWYKKIGFHDVPEWTLFGGDIKEVLKNLSE